MLVSSVPTPPDRAVTTTAQQTTLLQAPDGNDLVVVPAGFD
jgi:hypothetical protein